MTYKQLLVLEKDIESGLVMTVTTKHYHALEAENAKLEEKNKKLRKELRKYQW